ncbi:MAG: hypothetical protein L0K86_17710 [Actinomycetia bacterium]|nr:hypothetical protein [Actinomycetes bacterium]
MGKRKSADAPSTTRRLPPAWVVCLAALALPRAIWHDLGDPATIVNLALTVCPPLVWIAVVLVRRVPNPFVALLVVGLVYGVALGVVHELTWSTVWGDDPPSLGGNLAGALPSGVETLVMRTFACLSSIVTGLLVGAVSGGVAFFGARLRRR